VIALRAVPEFSRAKPAGAPISVLAKGPNLHD
jgi:hypothetical protein